MRFKLFVDCNLSYAFIKICKSIKIQFKIIFVALIYYFYYSFHLIPRQNYSRIERAKFVTKTSNVKVDGFVMTITQKYFIKVNPPKTY